MIYAVVVLEVEASKAVDYSGTATGSNDSKPLLITTVINI